MSEILSQAQIDSLLGQKDVLGISNSADSASAPQKDYNALDKVIELFDEQAGTVVSTILNKTVTFEKTSCEKTDAAKAMESVEAPMLLLTIPFKTGLAGELHCILSKKDIAHVSDLMMMGDGTAAYTEDHKDAIAELFSQIMGAFATAIGAKFGEQVSVDAIKATEYEFASSPFQIDASDMAVVKGMADGADIYKVLILIPDELSGQLIKKMNPDTGSAEDSGNSGAGGYGGSAFDSMNNDHGGDSFVETSLSGDSMRTSASHENIDMLLDVDLDVYIELGRTNLSIKRILELTPGSVVELDRMAGEPVDLLVNDKVVAKGEVVVVDENFGIRIVSLVSAEDRIKSLK
jgi:flagellar motor switch protein FliN/FliY